MDIGSLIVTLGYPAVALGTFLEGEASLVAAGFAAHHGYLDLGVVMLIATLASFSSDQIFFWLGRFAGPRITERWPGLRAGIERVNPMIERHPVKLVLGIRFLFGLRTVAPIALGMCSAMPSVRFVLLSLVGATVWAVSGAAGGYFFGQAIALVFSDAQPVVLALAVLAAIGFFVHRSRREKREIGTTEVSLLHHAASDMAAGGYDGPTFGYRLLRLLPHGTQPAGPWPVKPNHSIAVSGTTLGGHMPNLQPVHGPMAIMRFNQAMDLLFRLTHRPTYLDPVYYSVIGQVRKGLSTERRSERQRAGSPRESPPKHAMSVQVALNIGLIAVATLYLVLRARGADARAPLPVALSAVAVGGLLASSWCTRLPGGQFGYRQRMINDDTRLAQSRTETFAPATQALEIRASDYTYKVIPGPTWFRRG